MKSTAVLQRALAATEVMFALHLNHILWANMQTVSFHETQITRLYRFYGQHT